MKQKIWYSHTITELKMRFNKEIRKIKTQNVLKTSCAGWISVGSEKTFNNMSLATYNFYKAVFNPLHKSFYSDVDLRILNDSLTVVPIGSNWHICK